jgi:hypothetical protein
MTCPLQDAGTIDLYCYGELPPAARLEVDAHLPGCPACRQALEELSIIRAALAARPDVAAPPDGWPAFMARLDAAVAADAGSRATVPDGARWTAADGARWTASDAAPWTASDRAPGTASDAAPWTAWGQGSGYLAAAAAVALVTLSVLFAPHGSRPGGDTPSTRPMSGATRPAPQGGAIAAGADPALVSLSGQHFERSKLVVLGLATREPVDSAAGDWAYERELAATLLGDTRLYRQAAEARGMNAIADVMRDLELVLLQTSMSRGQDAESLEQLQRLIRRRDLLTRMDVVHAAGP